MAPSTIGLPMRIELPSLTMSTSSKVVSVSTARSSFSTSILSPAVTRYCLPPVLITAYAIVFFLKKVDFPGARFDTGFESSRLATGGEFTTPNHLQQGFFDRNDDGFSDYLP